MASRIEELTAQASYQKALMAELREAHGQTCDELMAELGTGGKRYVEGIGEATVTKPTKAWVVKDREAFIEWVRANEPDALTVETIPAYSVEKVTPAWETALLKNGVPDADGVVPDGVEFVTKSAPSLRVSPQEGAYDAVRRALGAMLSELPREVEA